MLNEGVLPIPRDANLIDCGLWWPSQAQGRSPVWSRNELWPYRRTDTVKTHDLFVAGNCPFREFYASIQRRRPIEALGQKCGMDSPDAIAVDLRGNVMTCQNTGAKGVHKIGHVDDFSAIALDTATHFAFRPECVS